MDEAIFHIDSHIEELEVVACSLKVFFVSFSVTNLRQNESILMAQSIWLTLRVDSISYMALNTVTEHPLWVNIIWVGPKLQWLGRDRNVNLC